MFTISNTKTGYPKINWRSVQWLYASSIIIARIFNWGAHVHIVNTTPSGWASLLTKLYFPVTSWHSFWVNGAYKVTFPVIAIESTFSLLPLGTYLLSITTLYKYLSRNISKNFIFTTLSENITITRCGAFLVTIPILCFVMVQWIQWIQRKSFRKNSNGPHNNKNDCRSTLIKHN